MRFSYSDVRLFKACRRQWDLGSKNRKGWRKKAPNKNLFLGSGIHKALEFWYRKDWDMQKVFKAWFDHKLWKIALRFAWSDFKEKFDNNYKKFMWYARNQNKNNVIDIYLNEEELKTYREQKELGLKMLKNYKDFAEKNDNFTVVMPEKYVTKDIGMGNQLSGRIDMIVKDEDGFYWNWENKTASNFKVEDLDTKEQDDMYTLLAGLEFDKNIVGTIYNVLIKDFYNEPRVLKSGKLSTAKNQNTSFRKYKEALKDMYDLTEKNILERVEIYDRVKDRDFKEEVKELVYKNENITKNDLCFYVGKDDPINKKHNISKEILDDLKKLHFDLKKLHADKVPEKNIEYLHWLQDNEKTFFVRHKVYKTPKEKHSYKMQLRDTMTDMLDNPRIYKNPGLMTCRFCSFQEICREIDKGGNWKELLENDFEKGNK